MKTIKIIIKIAVLCVLFLFASKGYAQCSCPPNAPAGECQTFYRDNDGDGKGDPNVTVYCIDAPSGYVSNSNDCNDNDSSNACEGGSGGSGGGSGCTKKTWYVDNDNDGYGANSSSSYHQGLPSGELGAVAVRSCTKPSGPINYVLNRDDCNDLSSGTHMKTFYRDADGDGFGVTSNTVVACDNPGGGWVTQSGDCNDDPNNNGSTYNPATRWYLDADRDGHGHSSASYISSCTRPSSDYFLNSELTTLSGDCNDGNASLNVLKTWYRDFDGDGYGSSSNTTQNCSQPAGYVANSSDCNDSDYEQQPGAVWYEDADLDGYGNPHGATRTQCSKPGVSGDTQWVSNDGDCDDTVPGGPPYWYLDEDGDGLAGNRTVRQCDRPSNGYTTSEDCDDSDPNKGAAIRWYIDRDRDGLGANKASLRNLTYPQHEFGDFEIVQCTKPTGLDYPYVENNDDCYDVPDGGTGSEGPGLLTYYFDQDLDGWGVTEQAQQFCNPPGVNWSLKKDDCNDDPNNNGFLEHPETKWYKDTDGDRYPFASYIQDCEKPGNDYHLEGYFILPLVADCDDEDPLEKPGMVWYADLDGDGYSSGYTLTDCRRPEGYYAPEELIQLSDDCNDNPDNNGKKIHPDTKWYADVDQDGYPAAGFIEDCEKPSDDHYLASELTSLEVDCDDGDVLEKPGAIWYRDADRDMYGNGISVEQCTRPNNHFAASELAQTGGDCDDNDKDEKPGAVWYKDKDGDRYSDGTSVIQCERPADFFVESELIATSGDCDDDDSEKKPGANWYADFDGDGLGDPSNTFQGCEPPANFVTNGNDSCPTRWGTNNGCPVLGINYIKTRSARISGVALPDISSRPYQEVSLSTSYFDGLGNVTQQVVRANSPRAQDVVAPTEYDELGRVEKEYLPYVSSTTDGSFQPNALSENYSESDQFTFYQITSGIENDPIPYAQKKFDGSPLSRVVEQAAAGSDWQLGDKSIKFNFKVNEIGDDVVRFNWNQLKTQGVAHFSVGQLMKNEVIDEDGKSTIEYSNQRGQVLLKESKVEVNLWARTYYVYDDLGQLRVVIPPEAAKNLTNNFFGKSQIERQSFLDTWTFQYKYDDRRRMIEKKVPGADEIIMVYDSRDRLVLTQDGNQRDPSIGGGVEWTFTKYDELNRPIITGIMSDIPTIVEDVKNHAIPSEQFNGPATQTHQYTNVAFPAESSGLIKEYLTITYYDHYDFRTGSDLSGTWYNRPIELQEEDDYHIRPRFNGRVKGQVTGTLTKHLNTDDFLTTISYYDDRYRVIQVVSENHLGGIDVISNQYDFTGGLRKTLSEHDNGSTTTKIFTEYEYDHANRLKDAYHTIDDGTRVHLYSNEYNELGELIKKKLHGSTEDTSFAQSIDYEYNIRGWLKSINESGLPGSVKTPDPDDLFSLELIYNSSIQGLTNN